MTKVIIHGAAGYMGRVLTDMISREADMKVVAGIDVVSPEGVDFPVFSKAADCNVEADVLIDFSNAKAIDALVDFCESQKVPAVICTTAISEEQQEKIASLSQRVPVLRSANMSLGVNTIFDILKRSSKIFSDAGFDIEIVEKHHNRKLDAPSGTAIALADAINESMDNKFTYNFDRSSKMEKRGENEIGIVAVRGGNIVGEHEVIFAGMDEVITIKHTATSRGVFATGALEAAKFLSNAKPGMYSMADVINCK